MLLSPLVLVLAPSVVILCLPCQPCQPSPTPPAASESYIWRPPHNAHKPHQVGYGQAVCALRKQQQLTRRPHVQVVMLGAGMDARPWRMKLPAGEGTRHARGTTRLAHRA